MIKKALCFSIYGPWGNPDSDNNHPGYQHPRKYSEWFKSRGFDNVFVGAPLFDCILLLFNFESEEKKSQFENILPIEIKSDVEIYIDCPEMYLSVWDDNIKCIQPTIEGYEILKN